MLGSHSIARSDQHLDDGDVLEIAEIGHGHRLHRRRGLAHGALVVLSRLFRQRLENRPVLLGARVDFCRTAGALAVALQRSHGAARGNPIADLDLHVDDLPRGRRWHIHRGLLRLERHETLLGLHDIAGLDEYLDDLYVGKITKVRYDDFHGEVLRR